MTTSAKASGAVVIDNPDGAAVINGYGSSTSLTASGLSAAVTNNGSTGAITATATAGGATVSSNSSSSGIAATAAGGPVSVTNNGSLSGGKAGGITARGGGGPLTITGNGSISSGGIGIDARASDDSAVTIAVSKGLSAGANAITVETGGTAEITLGAGISGHAVALQCNAAAGVTVNNNGSVSAAAASDTGAGSLTFNNHNAAASGFTAKAGTVSIFNNGPSAHWSLSAGGTFALDGEETFNNQGIFELKRLFFMPPYQVTFAGLDAFHNQAGGTLSLAADTTLALTGNDSFVNDGTITLGSGAQLLIDGVVTNQGTIALAGEDGFAASVTLLGAYHAEGDAQLAISADLTTGQGNRLTLNGDGSGLTRLSLILVPGDSSGMPGGDLIVVANAGGARFETDQAIASTDVAPFACGTGTLIREVDGVQHWFGCDGGDTINYVIRRRRVA